MTSERGSRARAGASWGCSPDAPAAHAGAPQSSAIASSAALLADTDRLLRGGPVPPPPDWRVTLRLPPSAAAALDDEIANGPPTRRPLLLRLLERALQGREHVLALMVFLEARHYFDAIGTKRPAERHPRSRDLPRCGARARSRDGAPCRAPVVCRRDVLGRLVLADRCRLHGGLSTGPTTPEGRERSAAAARERWVRWRAERASAAPASSATDGKERTT